MFGFITTEVANSENSRQRKHDADAEEDRHGLVAAVASLHQAHLQRAELLRGARRLLADPLDEAHQLVEARLIFVVVANAAGGQLFEPAIDRDRAVRHQRERRGADQYGAENERQQWHQHATPRF